MWRRPPTQSAKTARNGNASRPPGLAHRSPVPTKPEELETLKLADGEGGFVVGVGFVSGVLNTSLSTNGPPLVFGLQARHLGAAPFRATISTVFAFSNIVGSLGVSVMAISRPLIDTDQDGVPDGLDRCPDTPRGATVSTAGCPSDTDKDGVEKYATEIRADTMQMLGSRQGMGGGSGGEEGGYSRESSGGGGYSRPAAPAQRPAAAPAARPAPAPSGFDDMDDDIPF